jgi:hypothetical protein
MPRGRSKEISMSGPRSNDQPEVKPHNQARQGVTGHNVRYVLGLGMAFAIIAGIILYFTVGN